MTSNASEDAWIVIGKVAGPFGIRGEVKIELLTDFPERFDSLESVRIGAQHLAYTIEAVRRHKRQILLKLQGIDAPEAVEALRDQELMVPRTEAMRLPHGHYFLEDLLGLQVEVAGGRMLGPITEVLRTGSNDVYIVGRGSDAILIPGIRD
ncbi:MAG: ribosome maturation factor RimM, partial [Chloroflexota bacterium]